jgi:hypothetical protein
LQPRPTAGAFLVRPNSASMRPKPFMRIVVNHKFSAGQNVYYDPQFGNNASRGKYKIVRSLPIERDKRLSYRIKSTAESFERIAEEYQLTRTD